MEQLSEQRVLLTYDLFRPLFINCPEGVSLLKKSPPDRSVVPKQARTTYKMGFSTSEQGSESDAREFFNKLYSSRKPIYNA